MPQMVPLSAEANSRSLIRQALPAYIHDGHYRERAGHIASMCNLL